MAWRISVSASGSFGCPPALLRRASRVVIRSRSWGTIGYLPARKRRRWHAAHRAECGERLRPISMSRAPSLFRADREEFAPTLDAQAVAVVREQRAQGLGERLAERGDRLLRHP